MRTVDHLEAQARLGSLLDEAASDGEPILIKRRRGENAVLVSARLWAGMEETLHLLSSPANAQHLIDGIARFDASECDPPG